MTGSPASRLPFSISSRICCQPSERTTCSTPASSTAAESQRDRCAASIAPGSEAPAGAALAAMAPGSRLACQMIRASGAGRLGSSAKVEPPLVRVCGSSDPCAARCGAGGDLPGHIGLVAPQPVPHQAVAIDATKFVVRPLGAPVGDAGARHQLRMPAAQDKPVFNPMVLNSVL